MNKHKSHHARLSRSERLQRVFNLLLDGAWHTTREIIRRSNVCAVNSIVDELRDNGILIACERKKDKWYYRLERT